VQADAGENPSKQITNSTGQPVNKQQKSSIAWKPSGIVCDPPEYATPVCGPDQN